MKEFKGTKGEWKIDRHPEIDSSGRQVFRLSCDQYESREEIKANAKLIAASPELLKALQKLSDEVWMSCSIGSDPELMELFKAHQDALKALNKALEG